MTGCINEGSAPGPGEIRNMVLTWKDVCLRAWRGRANRNDGLSAWCCFQCRYRKEVHTTA
jgi:hypothetical protein